MPQPPAAAYQVLGQLPHCDPTVLHKKGACEFCDRHPVWQALREVWGIAFTNEQDPEKIPCPSTRLRKAYEVNRWPGNRPTNEKVETLPPTAWQHLEDDELGRGID